MGPSSPATAAARMDETEIAADADDAGDFTADDAAAVHAALDRLAPEHREVLLLRFVEQMSYDEIARVVGSPLGTVRFAHSQREASIAGND